MLFKVFFPISVFPHVKWGGERGENQQNLPKNNCHDGPELIQDSHFRHCGRGGEMLNGGAELWKDAVLEASLSPVSPTSTEFKI